MPLAAFKPENVLDIADRLDAVVLKLRTLRQDMIKKGPEVFEVPWDKAEQYVRYLEKWSTRCADTHEDERRDIEKAIKKSAIEALAARQGKRTPGRPKKDANRK